VAKLKSYNTKTILVTIVWIIIIWSATAFLISAEQNSKNTNLIKGHLDHVEEGVGTGRASGSIWYNIYIQENPNSYKVSADNSHCFLFNSLKTQVKAGDPIQLYLNRPLPFFSIKKPMVVSATANSENYLSFYCINEEIENERVKFPLYLLGLGLLFTVLIFKKEVGHLLKDK
jgi:hypothetical protein